MAMVLLLVISGCVSNTPVTPTPTPAITQTTAPTTVAPTTAVPTTVQPTTIPGKFAIEIKDSAFVPANISITKGSTVTWTQKDTIPHSVTGPGFNSSQLKQGQTYNYTFNNVGKFNYSCLIHPAMKGYITVT